MNSIAAFLILCLAVAAGACGDEEELPSRGVDVSHHQGEIDWPQLRWQGIDFAYVKATEGGDWNDPRYPENLAGARAAGIVTGSYHFFTFCRDGLTQARHFLSRADLRAGDLFPVVDVERAGNCKADPEPAALWREVKAFQDTVEEAIGVRPIIYTTWWFHVRKMGPEFRGEKFWIRNLVWKPGKAIPWVFWQKDVRPMRGVKGRIDENEFHTGRHGLTEFTLRPTAKAQNPVSSM